MRQNVYSVVVVLAALLSACGLPQQQQPQGLATPSGNPELRYTYNIVDVAGGIRIFVRFEIITNPGSGFERPTDITQGMGAEIQAELVKLRAAIGR